MKLNYRTPFGIGKIIYNDIYFHKEYLCLFPSFINKRATLISSDYNYNIVKYNFKSNEMSFIFSPNFNESYYPIVVSSLKLYNDLTSKIRYFKNNPPIYHQRWKFVKSNYQGFDIQLDKKFCRLWENVPGLDSMRYGRIDHWENISLPKVFCFYQVSSIDELLCKF